MVSRLGVYSSYLDTKRRAHIIKCDSSFDSMVNSIFDNYNFLFNSKRHACALKNLK